MNVRTLLPFLLLGCGSAATEPPGGELPDAMPGELDAMPGPKPARVKMTVAGAPLSGTPVIFHDATGAPTHVLLTGTDGYAEAMVDPGAMATVLDLRGSAHLTTFVGVEPGDDLLVTGPEALGAEVTVTVHVDTRADSLRYHATVGCVEVEKDYRDDAELPPPVTVLTLGVPGGCAVEGKVRLHVTAYGEGMTHVLSTDVPVNQAEVLVDLKGQPWTQSATVRQITVRSLGVEAGISGAAAFVQPAGGLAPFDRFEGAADGEGTLTQPLRGVPTATETVVVSSPTPPLPMSFAADLTERTMEIEHRGPVSDALVADFAEVKGTVYLLSSEDKTIAWLLYLGLGDQTAMTGTVTTLLGRTPADSVVSWTLVHPAGVVFALPALPGAYASLRPVTLALSSASLERGTAFPDYRAFRNLQGRLPSRFTTYRSVIRVVSPTPPPLP
jgi:hypothetical protein